MRRVLFIMLFLTYQLIYSQVGINTEYANATLDVSADTINIEKADGLIAPRITGDQLKIKDKLYGEDQLGAIVYVTSVPDPASGKTEKITSPGYYFFNGDSWNSFKSENKYSKDATRFLGGSVYVRLNESSGGNLADSLIIGSKSGIEYKVGSLSQQSSKGGINSIKGKGFKVSNPKDGIFDINFDKEMSDIYGISVNIVDAYNYTGSAIIQKGEYPNPDEPGMKLFTNDNSQVSFISNTVIRIKTGNSDGVLSNRSFTFLVTGK